MGLSYRELIAWQKAMQLVTKVYRLTKTFPREELYGLTNQLRRAAVSVPSNIAEGQARFSQKEFCYFLSNSRGSLVEIETDSDRAESRISEFPRQSRGLGRCRGVRPNSEWPYFLQSGRRLEAGRRFESSHLQRCRKN